MVTDKFKTIRVHPLSHPRKFAYIKVILILTVLFTNIFFISPISVNAAINERINYQGKLTDTAGLAVTDGDYRMYFRLYTVATGGSNIFEENRSTTAGNRITVTSGLFSVMLGSSTALTNINFNQTLYLGVEICGLGSGAETCDGEMTPRKILGAVPAAFESKKLEGLGSAQFLRSDATNATSSAGTFLTITQNGAGNIAEFIGPSSAPVLTLLSSGNVGIGTTTPAKKLSVQGDALFSGDVNVAGLTATSSVYLALTSGTKVGIGTTTPGMKLSVEGNQNIMGSLTVANSIITGNLTATGTLTFTGVATTTFGGGVSAAGLASSAGLTITGGDILYTGANFRVTSGGNVGIGELAPGSKLSVSGGGSFGSSFDITAAPINGLMVEGKTAIGTSTPSAGLTVWGGLSGAIPPGYVYHTLFDVVDAASTTLFSVMEDGKVGVGTTTPYTMFAVAGESNADYFTSDSTSATSTFANHISIGAAKEFRINGVGVLTENSSSALIAGDLTGNARGADSLDVQSFRSVITEVASGATAMAVGIRNTASQTGSMAFGLNNTSSGVNASAVGYINVTSANNASAFGRSNEATADQSSAFGNRNFTSAQSAVAFGTLNNSTGATLNEDTGAISGTASASSTIGINSSALGVFNSAAGLRSTAIGFQSKAYGIGSIAIGNNISNNIASSTMIGPSNTAKITILNSGYTGIGTTTPARTLDVEGTFGGKYVINDDALTSTQTVTETESAISYYFHNNTGTTNLSITITYNITGLPNVDGTVVLFRTLVEKGVTALAQTSTIILQINGAQILSSATANTTAAATRIGNASFVRIGGSWIRLGISTADSNDVAEWIEYNGETPEAGDLLVISSDGEEKAEIAPAIPYNEKLIGIVSSQPEVLMGNPGELQEKTMLALAGRVPAKVTTENGPIKAGDYITSSSLKGAGMKATKPGRVVGIALEDWSGGGIGQIIVMLDNSFYFGEGSDDLMERVANLEILSGSFGSSSFSMDSILEFFESLGVRIMNGIAYFKEIVVEKFTVGSPEKPTGITLFDEITGNPYCLSIRNGVMVSQSGICEVVEIDPPDEPLPPPPDDNPPPPPDDNPPPPPDEPPSPPPPSDDNQPDEPPPPDELPPPPPPDDNPPPPPDDNPPPPEG